MARMVPESPTEDASTAEKRVEQAKQDLEKAQQNLRHAIRMHRVIGARRVYRVVRRKQPKMEDGSLAPDMENAT